MGSYFRAYHTQQEVSNLEKRIGRAENPSALSALYINLIAGPSPQVSPLVSSFLCSPSPLHFELLSHSPSSNPDLTAPTSSIPLDSPTSFDRSTLTHSPSRSPPLKYSPTSPIPYYSPP